MCGTTASFLSLICDMRNAGHYEDAEDMVRKLRSLAEGNGELQADSAVINEVLSKIEPTISAAKAADKNHVPPKIRISEICSHGSFSERH